jgi:hypothetical protein
LTFDHISLAFINFLYMNTCWYHKIHGNEEEDSLKTGL